MSLKNYLVNKKPIIMGILNITPDSFSDGGKYFNFEEAISHAKELINQGIDIIDIGGESTRPGAVPVSEGEELRRIIPIIEELDTLRINSLEDGRRKTENGHLPSTFYRLPSRFLISIDTYKSNVAQKAIEAGANIINDVSGLTMDPDMVHVAAKLNCLIVIMHNRGIPATKPVSECRSIGVSAKNNSETPLHRYTDTVIKEVYTWLKKQTDFAINNGIKKENIIIDPGISFGKTPEEDLILIKNLKEFKSLGFPILVGPSRKSFIKKLFGEKDFEAKNKEIIDLCIKNRADIVRVH